VLNYVGSIARRKCCVDQLAGVESYFRGRPEGALHIEPVDINGTIAREVIDGRYDAGCIGSHHELWFALFKMQEEDH
jgi:hypothetical protein